MLVTSGVPSLFANGNYQIEISSVPTTSCNVQFNNDWSSIVEILICTIEQILNNVGQLLSQYSTVIAGIALTTFVTSKILMLPIIRNLLARIL